MTPARTLPHDTSLAEFMPKGRADVWAEKVRRLIKAGDVRKPEAILAGLGMDDPHHVAQVLRALGEGK